MASRLLVAFITLLSASAVSAQPEWGGDALTGTWAGATARGELLQFTFAPIEGEPTGLASIAMLGEGSAPILQHYQLMEDRLGLDLTYLHNVDDDLSIGIEWLHPHALRILEWEGGSENPLEIVLVRVSETAQLAHVDLDAEVAAAFLAQLEGAWEGEGVAVTVTTLARDLGFFSATHQTAASSNQAVALLVGVDGGTYSVHSAGGLHTMTFGEGALTYTDPRGNVATLTRVGVDSGEQVTLDLDEALDEAVAADALFGNEPMPSISTVPDPVYGGTDSMDGAAVGVVRAALSGDRSQVEAFFVNEAACGLAPLPLQASCVDGLAQTADAIDDFMADIPPGFVPGTTSVLERMDVPMVDVFMAEVELQDLAGVHDPVVLFIVSMEERFWAAIPVARPE